MTLLIKKKKHLESREKFEEFAKKHPKHKLIENVSYWIGETYYGNQEYSKAAEIFLESYQKYPTANKAPDSLLKLGLSLLNAKEKEGACGAFQEFQKKFSEKKDMFKRVNKEYKKAKCA